MCQSSEEERVLPHSSSPVTEAYLQTKNNSMVKKLHVEYQLRNKIWETVVRLIYCKQVKWNLKGENFAKHWGKTERRRGKKECTLGNQEIVAYFKENSWEV